MSAVLPPAAGPAHVGLDPARAQHEEGEVGVLHRQARSQHVLHTPVQYSTVQYSTVHSGATPLLSMLA